MPNPGTNPNLKDSGDITLTLGQTEPKIVKYLCLTLAQILTLRIVEI